MHANATTAPKTQAYILTRKASVAELARELGGSATTVRRWRGRKDQALQTQPQVRQTPRHRTDFLSHAERAAFIAGFVEVYKRTR